MSMGKVIVKMGYPGAPEATGHGGHSFYKGAPYLVHISIFKGNLMTFYGVQMVLLSNLSDFQ